MKKVLVLLLLVSGATHFAQERLSRATFLGIAPESAAAGELVVVSQLFPGGTADVLGIKVGDEIRSINERPVTDFNSMRAILSEITEGMEVSVVVARKKKSLTLKGQAVGRQKETAANASVQYGEFEWQDNIIRTITYLPDTPRKDKAGVMFIQGFTCDSIDYGMVPNITISQLLRHYVAAGFTVFKMEKPGVGDSLGPRDCMDYEFNYENAAFHAGLAHFKSYPEINPDKVFIFGHSLGVLHGATIAAKGKAYGVMGYGGVFKNWHDYMQDVFSKQSVSYWGVSEEQARDNLELIKPLLKDWMISDKDWAEILEEQTTKEVLESQLLVINGEQVMGRHYSFFRAISRHDFQNDWANSQSHVLMMHGEYDIQTVESGWQDDIAEHVNRHRPGTATAMSFERTEHALMQYPSVDALLEAMANRQFNPADPGEHYNSDIAEASLGWMQKLLAN